jgi:hypothetical protein
MAVIKGHSFRYGPADGGHDAVGAGYGRENGNIVSDTCRPVLSFIT